MKYVLFREDPNTHKEVYFVRRRNNIISSPDASRAYRFLTAELAYAFGQRHGMQWWRVGPR